jgi:hypothetical protein
MRLIFDAFRNRLAGEHTTLGRLDGYSRSADSARPALPPPTPRSTVNEADNAYRAALGAVSSAERLSLLDYLK